MAWWHRTEHVRTVILVLTACILAWEAGVYVFAPKPFILPAPSQVFVELIAHPAYYAEQSWYTIKTTATGFGLAVLLGVAIAVGIVYSRFLERTLYTVLVALNSVPKVALAPLFVIWMGTGAEPKIAIALMIAIFSIVIDTVLGLRSVDPDMIALARSARAPGRHILFKIRFPNALPSMFAGMKVGISFALVGAIVGEFVAGEIGLGHVILVSQSMFNTPRVFAAIVLLGVIGTVLFFLVDVCERLMLPWHVSQRGHGGH